MSPLAKAVTLALTLWGIIIGGSWLVYMGLELWGIYFAWSMVGAAILSFTVGAIYAALTDDDPGP